MRRISASSTVLILTACLHAMAAEKVTLHVPARTVTVTQADEVTTLDVPASVTETVTADAYESAVVDAALTPLGGIEEGMDPWPIPLACYDSAEDCASRASQVCRDHGGLRGRAKLVAGTCSFSCGNGARGTCTRVPTQ